MVHFDAFEAFSADALVHFGSGIQVQPNTLIREKKGYSLGQKSFS